MSAPIPSSTTHEPHVIVLGLGFGGLRTVLDLAKSLPRLPAGTRVTGIDAQERHVFTPLLYEVATAHIRTRDGQGVRDVVAGSSFSYQEIFDRLPDAVQFRQGKVAAVDPERKCLKFVDGSEIVYDILVFAPGSAPEYFGVQGAEQFGRSFKTVEDALSLREQLLAAITACRKESCPVVRVVVAGAGPTGTELTGEMTGLIAQLTQSGVVRPGAVEIHLINMEDRVLPVLHPSTSRKAGARLQQAGVHLHLSKKIIRVEEKAVYLDDASVLPYDLFVWAGGVRGCSLAAAIPGISLTKRGTIEVDGAFRVRGLSDVFALGDAVCFLQPSTKTPVPGLAQEAKRQGSMVAKNVARVLRGQEPQAYKPLASWTVAIPLAGRYALIDGKHVRFAGRLGFLVRIGADVSYFSSLLPLALALRHWWRGARVFRRNNPKL